MQLLTDNDYFHTFVRPSNNTCSIWFGHNMDAWNIFWRFLIDKAQPFPGELATPGHSDGSAASYGDVLHVPR